MTAVIFLGPTLSVDEARQELDADYLPPAAQSDVYLAARRQPVMIGIVDGYFQRVPSVWHKEILWAMSRGIHVFGSASMGALRAAELEVFGMEGVGAVFAAFRDGVLEDDDEVAVIHGPAVAGYAAQSEAMVNIRATLRRAQDQSVIGPETGALLERTAKSLFYPERSYPHILAIAAGHGAPDRELAALGSWLPEGQVNQKRNDAIAMLRVMRERMDNGLQPKRTTFTFEHTVFWEKARTAAELATSDEETSDADLAPVLEEARLEGWYHHARGAARARSLAVEQALRQGARVSAQMLQETAIAFRVERGLLEPQDAERWLEENGLSEEDAHDLMEQEALLRWVRRFSDWGALRALPDHLRASGEYARLSSRARDKHRALEEAGLAQPSLEDIGLSEDALFHWYFEERLGRSLEADLEAHARRVGFPDLNAFRRAVVREYCYCQKRS
jgi:hypothetical protein